MNIGFKEAKMLVEKFQCFIFHDVDMLPENDANPYTCPDDGMPRQLVYSVSWNNYQSVFYLQQFINNYKITE